MCGSMYFIGGGTEALRHEGSTLASLRAFVPACLRAFWSRRHIGEDHLEPLGTVRLVLAEHLEGVAKFHQARVGGDELLAAGGALDAVEVGGQGKGPPAHL